MDMAASLPVRKPVPGQLGGSRIYEVFSEQDNSLPSRGNLFFCPSGQRGADELNVLESYVAMHSPSKEDNTKVKKLVQDIRGKLGDLVAKDEETKNLLLQMREVMVEQQNHIRALQEEGAKQQIADDEAKLLRVATQAALVRVTKSMKEIENDGTVEPEDDDKATPGHGTHDQVASLVPRTTEARSIAQKHDPVALPMLVPHSKSPVSASNSKSGPWIDENMDVATTRMANLERELQQCKLKLNEAVRAKEGEEKTTLFWKRRAESKDLTIKSLERIIKEQKKMIAPPRRSQGSTDRAFFGSSRLSRRRRKDKGDRFKPNRSSGVSRKEKKGHSQVSLSSMSGSLALNLSWPPFSSSESSDEDCHERNGCTLPRREETFGKERGHTDDTDGDGKNTKADKSFELTASQEDSFGLVQKFYSGKTADDGSLEPRGESRELGEYDQEEDYDIEDDRLEGEEEVEEDEEEEEEEEGEEDEEEGY